MAMRFFEDVKNVETKLDVSDQPQASVMLYDIVVG
jgi:hypothetical protein